MNDIESAITIGMAEAVSYTAHQSVNQKRKYTDEIYFVHCRSVANIVKRYTHLNCIGIAAAYLHDIIEDTPITEKDLRYIFPEEIVDIVIELTHIYTHEDFPQLNRAKRKELEAERLFRTSAAAQTIKCADIMDNNDSIVKHDSGFARYYTRECLHLVKGFEKAEDYIRKMAYDLLMSNVELLDIDLNKK